MDDKWISVDSELPQLDTLVLTARAGRLRPWYYDTGKRIENENWEHFPSTVWVDSYGAEITPSYWQPITPPAQP